MCVPACGDTPIHRGERWTHAPQLRANTPVSVATLTTKPALPRTQRRAVHHCNTESACSGWESIGSGVSSTERGLCSDRHENRTATPTAISNTRQLCTVDYTGKRPAVIPSNTNASHSENAHDSRHLQRTVLRRTLHRRTPRAQRQAATHLESSLHNEHPMCRSPTAHNGIAMAKHWIVQRDHNRCEPTQNSGTRGRHEIRGRKRYAGQRVVCQPATRHPPVC